MTSERVSRLRDVKTIRSQCRKVLEVAEANKLQFFEYHPERGPDVVKFCHQVIDEDYKEIGYDKIPPHGRWRHLDAGRLRIQSLVNEWKQDENQVDDREICKRLLDLFLVSVLLDAGAGKTWQYEEPGTTDKYGRSEGLAVASFHMFCHGLFTDQASTQPYRVDASGLSQITLLRVGEAMQVSEGNHMEGLEGRTELLQKLADSLRKTPRFFGEDARPGNIIDYLETQMSTEDGMQTLPVAALWHVLIEGLQDIWPSRTQLDGVSLGDVWECAVLDSSDNLVPFHKLTQWTCYSLLEVIQKMMKWNVTGVEDMTGLPEYRNGGLLIDFGMLKLRDHIVLNRSSESGLPLLEPWHPAVIEWRAMTVNCLDNIHAALRKELEFNFTLAQVLESATWKGGRKIAAQLRPASKGPPIEIISDGTVF